MATNQERSRSIRKTVQASIEKKLGVKIKPGQLTRELGQQLKETLGSKITQKVQDSELTQQARVAATQARSVMQDAAREAAKEALVAAHTAAEAARKGLDEVLLGLEHRGLKIKESQDLIQRVGRNVLDRAEAVRSQVADNPKSPEWLKELTNTVNEVAARAINSVTKADEALSTTESVVADVTAEAAGSTTEATVSKAAEAMQPAHRASAKVETSPEANAGDDEAFDASLTEEEEEESVSLRKPVKSAKTKGAAKGTKKASRTAHSK